ncbi:hypothetical protein HS125_04375 [bacterium]|nr:hypothetical protein [bacterium]
MLTMAKEGHVYLLVSSLLLDELVDAPKSVAAHLHDLPGEALEVIRASDESRRLRDLYLAAGVVSPASIDDAHHVALATVAGAELLVSWNFRHIVHMAKIRGFNAVNLREGYGILEIRSPKEVV